MNKPGLFPFLCPLVMLLTMAAAGSTGLEWVTTEKRIQLPADAQEGVAEFNFTNHSRQPIKIISLEPSCDCLTARADQLTYAPGASGVIRVVIRPEGTAGTLERLVRVKTEPATAAPLDLHLTVEIPEAIAFAPRLLLWRAHNPAQEKTITITMDPEKCRIESVLCVAQEFQARLEPLSRPGAYRVAVMPTSTAAVQTVLRINAVVEGHPRTLVAQLMIQ